MKLRVFISGPYTHPDPEENTRIAMNVWDDLLDHDFIPFCPHWCHFQHLHTPRDYETWMQYDFEWLRKCDVLLRLRGESSGADREVALAKSLGIPVVYSVEELLRYERNEIL